MTHPGPLLTAEEVARTVRRSSETVLRWARQGKIPCLKLPSGQILFRQADVDELLTAGRQS